MKRLLLVLALMLTVMLCAATVSAETTLPEECPHCKTAVTWSPLTEEGVSTMAISGGNTADTAKHYYLNFEGESAEWAEHSVPKYVCIYMNGKTITAAGSRVFNVSGGTLTLMGGGTVIGKGFTSAGSNFGGAIRVQDANDKGRTLNLYDTTITTTGEDGRTAASGGVIYLQGATLNVYSGAVTGGHASNGGTVYVGDACTLNIYGGSVGGGTAGKAGGSVYVAEGGSLNVEGGEVLAGTSGTNGATVYHGGASFTMSGGTLTGGASSNAGGAVYVLKGCTFDMSGGKIQGGTATRLGPCVYIPSTAKLILSGSASIEEVKFSSYDPSLLHVKGKVTGKVTFRGASGQADDGFVIGTADNVDTKGASYGIYNTEYYILGKGTDLVISTIAAVEPVTVTPGYCQACQKEVDWMSYGPNDYEYNTYLRTGHYYIENEETICNWKSKFIVGNDAVCLDLRGKTLVGSNRAFDLTKGELNIMDTVGGGVITACGPTNVATVYGGTFFVREPSTLNLYGGKLTYDLPTDDRSIVTRGGVVYTLGRVNVYGGEISGGAATVGANIYVDANKDGIGSLGLYGGTVGSNVKLPSGSTTGPCIVTRTSTTISGNPQVTELLLTSAAGYSPEVGDRITMEGTFTGNVAINVATYTSGMDLGTAANVDFSQGKLTIVDDKTAVVTAIDGELYCITGTPAALVRKADGTAASYETLAAAIEAAGETDLVILLADAANVEVSKLIHVDLNGFDIAGASGEGVLVCKDNKTNDFDVSDNAYGVVSGDVACTLAGMAAGAPHSEDNYLMIQGAEGASFHCVRLEITEAVLRPNCAGIYYVGSFLGDGMVADKVENMGVILNTAENPNVSNMESTSRYTVMDGTAFNNDSTSCLLTGVMKTENDNATNTANAATAVYAAAYVKLADGTVLMGNVKTTNLKAQAETIDAAWIEMDMVQKRAFVQMYKTYADAITEGEWVMTNAKSVVSREVIFNTTDYTPYLGPWNYDVVEAAKADGKVHYYFMAGEGLHISDTQTYKDKWGDAYLIVFPNGQTLLVDTGPLAYAPVLAKNLEMMGITHLDAVLITHPHSDHHNGAFSDSAYLLVGLLDKIAIDKVYYRGGYDLTRNDATLISRTCTALNIPHEVMDRGDVLQFGDVKLECVWPLMGAGDAQISGGEEVNNMSIVMRLDFGEHSSLLTGDLYLEGEWMILERVDQSLLDVDLLKVPHHGYATSSSVDFINAASPEIAVSVGRLPIPARISNRYANLGITFLDDRTKGYVEVVASSDGTMTYTTTRTEENDTTTPGDDTIETPEDNEEI